MNVKLADSRAGAELGLGVPIAPTTLSAERATASFQLRSGFIRMHTRLPLHEVLAQEFLRRTRVGRLGRMQPQQCLSLFN